MDTNSLEPSSTYDDQGLRFTLVLGLVLIVVMVGLTFSLASSSVLWLKRLYRPNHTLEPLPRGSNASLTPEASPAREASSAATPTEGVARAAGPELVVRTYDTSGRSVLRRKRVGISLPYRSSFLSLPTLRDWLSVEEASVPHLQSALETPITEGGPGTNEQQHLQFVGSRTVVPLSPAISSPALPQPPSYGAVNQHTQFKPPPPPPQTAVEAEAAEVEDCKHIASVYEKGREGAAVSAPSPLIPLALGLPRTPLDPQVALYVFTLKYFLTLTLLGGIFTTWICLVAAGGDFIVWYMVRRDIHKCHAQDSNATGCQALRPFCQYEGSDIGCSPVALHGLYDLTVMNIRPRSARWWAVGFLNVGFAAVFVLATVFFMKRVTTYVQEVRRLQLRHALGHRVVCVRGLSPRDIASESAFRRRFLSASTYFTAEETGGGGEVYFERLDCTGARCLFSAVSCHCYRTYRGNAVFTEPGKAHQVLFTRDSPPGTYQAIHHAENSLAALQEAIAEEKALHRRGGERVVDGGTVEVTVEPGTPVQLSAPPERLMVRAPFPYCCGAKIASVPLHTLRFRKHAAILNHYLDKVPQQETSGAAFVVFADSLCAFEFVNLFTAFQGGNVGLANIFAVVAGPPGQVIQNNVLVHRYLLLLRFLLLTVLFVVLLFTWSIPVGFLGSLDNIAEVPGIGPDLADLYHTHVPLWLRSIFTAYLPVIVLAIFNMLLPSIIRFMVIAMGAFNASERDQGHMYLQYIFMVLTTVVFQAALQGGLKQIADLVADPDGEAVVNFFVACVSPSGGYWYAKVVMGTCLTAWMDVLDPAAFVRALLLGARTKVQRSYDLLFIPCEFQYPLRYSFDLTMLSMGILFHMTVPLLNVFVIFYFVVRYITQRARLYDRYRPSLPPLEDCTDFTVTAQVLRCVLWLFCLAETGAVLLMSLRKHTGGVVLCSLTLATGLLLLVYGYVRTRDWVTDLHSVRRVYRENPEFAATPLDQEASAEHSGNDDRVDEYEVPGLSVFSRRHNPFIGHLLPHKPEACSRYTPKHQRLARINVDTEIEKMMSTEFIVERYWDRNMTWFETDNHESGTIYPASSA